MNPTPASDSEPTLAPTINSSPPLPHAPLHWRDTVIWAGVATVLLALVTMLSSILLPFVAAALTAYMVEPLVKKMDGLRISRPFSAVLVLLALLAVFLGLIQLLWPLVIEQIVPLIERAPELPKILLALLQKYFPRVAWEAYLNAEALRQFLTTHQSEVSGFLNSIKETVLQSGGNILAALANTLLYPVALFYFILAWPFLSEKSPTLFPPRAREIAQKILADIDSVLAEYLRGQVLVMLALALYYSVTLTITGLPHGFSLGVLTGLFVLIPYIGFAIGCVLSLFMAILTGDTSIIVWVGIVFLIGQLMESYVLTPILVGERIGLHPLAVIFALIAFAQLLGFIGVLLALPASAVVLVLLRHLLKAYYQSRFYQLS